MVCYTDYATQFNHKSERYSQLVPLFFRLMELCSNNTERTFGVCSVSEHTFLFYGGLMKKKYLAFCVLFVLLLVAMFSLPACAKKDDSTAPAEEEKFIELNMDNYDYYLSIDSIQTNMSSVGSFGTSYSYKVTIAGAINGIYRDCTVKYKIIKKNMSSINNEDQEEEFTIKLNAAGFATFNYGYVNRGSFQILDVQGCIII